MSTQFFYTRNKWREKWKRCQYSLKSLCESDSKLIDKIKLKYQAPFHVIFESIEPHSNDFDKNKTKILFVNIPIKLLRSTKDMNSINTVSVLQTSVELLELRRSYCRNDNLLSITMSFSMTVLFHGCSNVLLRENRKKTISKYFKFLTK